LPNRGLFWNFQPAHVSGKTPEGLALERIAKTGGVKGYSYSLWSLLFLYAKNVGTLDGLLWAKL
jgi:hypothetical protein